MSEDPALFSCSHPSYVGFSRLSRSLLRSVLWACLIVLISNTASIPVCQATEPKPTDAPASAATSADPHGLEYFEKHVRPLLVKHCYECHGPDDRPQGNLRLDAAEYWLAGGDLGPALVPGKPDASLLLHAVRYEKDDLEMPPTGKMPAEEIAVFEQWIARGAPAPQATEIKSLKRSIDLEAGRQFWAYRPLSNPTPPMPERDEDRQWSKHAIDAFVIAKLREHSLSPSETADRRTFIRRLYFDLWGLPPTPAEIAAYERDESPDADEALVDSLLSSKHFAERWARHWLDVVRYGESLSLRGFVMNDAWRYRDYVIDSFHRDLPFDQFLREQIAGDLLKTDDLEEQQRRLVATTFLALGNHNLEEQDKRQLDMDVVDEQLDTLGKAFLGQTLGCARCHDHKFDPIPTRDYYAMAGILKNSKLMEHSNVSKWTMRSLPLPADEEAIYAARDAKIDDLEKKVQQVRKAVNRLKDSAKISDNVLQVSDVPGIVVDSSQAKRIGAWTESTSTKRYIGDGYLHDGNEGKGEKTLTFAPELPVDGEYEVRISFSAAESRAKDVPITIFSASGEKIVRIDQSQPPSIDNRFVSLGKFRFEKAGQSFVLISTEGTQGFVTADAVQFLSTSGSNEKTKRDEPQVADNVTDEAEKAAAAELAKKEQELKDLEGELKSLKEAEPRRPQVMTVVESKTAADCPIHVRGSIQTLGETVPRGFMQVVPSSYQGNFNEQSSGRDELARWLTAGDNPLPARVYANRVWHWLFGRGLVSTPDNFGATGEAPSHPELLDYLASEFVENDWSVKQLVRSIVLSKTYRQSSSERPEMLAADPENQWLWRVSRKRLEAECLRDAMLMVAGKLDPQDSGTDLPASVSSDFNFQQTSLRRSVYVPALRNAMPSIFEAFDAADPSLVVGKRNVSTVATQALFLLNDPFVQQRAKDAAEKLLSEQHGSESERIEAVFETCLGRWPNAEERQIAEQFLGDSSIPQAQRYAQLYQALFASLDFRYRD